jgi:hypothetical protein
MITVCVTVFNRSRMEYAGRALTPFPNLVRSLRASAERLGEEVELCVSDWGSTDWPLAEWLPGLWKGRLLIREIRHLEKFSVGHGKNVAAEHASGDTLLFADADMLVPDDYLTLVKDVCGGGSALFPVYWRNDDPEAAFWSREEWGREVGRRGFWGTGHGNAAVPKDVFAQTGGWPVKFSYGGEDSDFQRSVRRYCEVRRERVRGLVHQWHPKAPREVELGGVSRT